MIKMVNEYTGYRPLFSDKILKLDSQDILVQGYMFPLEQGVMSKAYFY